MILKGNAVDQLLKKPGPAIRAVIFYGPNEGKVRDYATRVARSVVDDLTDPFRVTHLLPADLKDDPARLADEAAAISMTGGRRVVRVRGAADAHYESITNFLDHPQGDSLVVIEAGELTRASRLRKLFESSPVCAIAACYDESAADLGALVTGHLRRNGLVINSDARAYLLQCLGEDRLAAIQELDKLVLYMRPLRTLNRAAECKAITGIMDTRDTGDIGDTGDVTDGFGVFDSKAVNDIVDSRDTADTADIPDILDSYDGADIVDGYDVQDGCGVKDTKAISARPVSLADVTSCIGDSSIQGLDSICDAMAAGDLPMLDSQLARAFEAAMTPVSILRSASNHLLRLQLALVAMAKGGSPDMAIRSLRPPLHFSRADSFKQQLRLWNLARLDQALHLLLQAEADCKTTGAPDHTLCSRAMIQVAQLASRKS